jgi:hypothetical protein
MIDFSDDTRPGLTAAPGGVTVVKYSAAMFREDEVDDDYFR